MTEDYLNSLDAWAETVYRNECNAWARSWGNLYDDFQEPQRLPISLLTKEIREQRKIINVLRLENTELINRLQAYPVEQYKRLCAAEKAWREHKDMAHACCGSGSNCDNKDCGNYQKDHRQFWEELLSALEGVR